MTISIIIPVFNEQEVLPETLRELRMRACTDAVKEIIVVDGNSEDRTAEIARAGGAKVVRSSVRSRSEQMNTGAARATGDILYFLHADSIPPDRYDRSIIGCLGEKKNTAGCFRLRFDHRHFLLQFYGWCTRFDIDLFRFGDQSLFLKKEFFQRIGGFDGGLKIMEDQEIVCRIRKKGEFEILPHRVVTSSRRYLRKGVVKLQLSFTLIIILDYLGLSQDVLVKVYNKVID